MFEGTDSVFITEKCLKFHVKFHVKFYCDTFTSGSFNSTICLHF